MTVRRSKTVWGFVPDVAWPGVVARVRSLLILPLVWHRRAKARHELAQLTAEQLADVGLHPKTVERIAAKPFWQA
mgnify:CR=1 FL=1